MKTDFDSIGLLAYQYDTIQYRDQLKNTFDQIDQRLVEVKEELDALNQIERIEYVHTLNEEITSINYMFATLRDWMNAYSSKRKCDISFVDEDDIFFIKRYLDKIQYSVSNIKDMLEQVEQDAFCCRDYLGDEARRYYVSCVEYAMAYKIFALTLNELQSKYQELYNAIYASTKEEKNERMQFGFFEWMRSRRVFEQLFDVSFDTEAMTKKINGCISPFQLQVIQTKNKHLCVCNDISYTVDKINSEQDRIMLMLRNIMPNLSKDELLNTDMQLAERMHNQRLSHLETNNVFMCYHELQQLQNIKSILAPSSNKKRGPKECTSFEDVDKDMLIEVFDRCFEVEKHLFHGEYPNQFAGLFLISMFRNQLNKIAGHVPKFYEILSSKISKYRLSLRSIQRTISEYTSKVREKVTTKITKWVEVVGRLIPELEKYELVFV